MTRSDDELGLGAKVDVVGTGDTELLGRKFDNERGGGEQMALLLGALCSQELVPLGCIVYPRRLVVSQRLRVVKLRARFGSPRLSCWCVPQDCCKGSGFRLEGFR